MWSINILSRNGAAESENGVGTPVQPHKTAPDVALVHNCGKRCSTTTAKEKLSEQRMSMDSDKSPPT